MASLLTRRFGPELAPSGPLERLGGVIGAEVRRLMNWEERHARLLKRLGIVLGATLALDLIGTIAIYFLERRVQNGEIHTFFDAFFFGAFFSTQPSMLRCLPALTANEPGGTSSRTVVPVPT